MADTQAKKAKPPKHPCIGCKKAVTRDHKSVQCQTCELWVHAECQSISDEMFNLLVNSESYGGLCWNCDSCLASTARLEKSVKAMEKRVHDVELVVAKTTSELRRVDESVEQLRKELQEEKEKNRLAAQQRDERYVTGEEYREREARKTNVILHRVS